MLPPHATLLLAVLASAVAFAEYADLAAARRRSDSDHSERRGRGRGMRVGGRRRARRSSSCALPPLSVIGILAVARGRPGPEVLRDAAASLFPMLYIGMPLGALAAVRFIGGRDATLLLIATIVVSDSAQYYTGEHSAATGSRRRSARRRQSRARLADLSSAPPR